MFRMPPAESLVQSFRAVFSSRRAISIPRRRILSPSQPQPLVATVQVCPKEN
jgi:hypothetical protein